MIENILTAAGLLHRKARHPSPPEGTYAVYFDNVGTDGADRVTHTGAGLPHIYRHDAEVQIYATKPDPAAEEALEAVLDAEGIEWTKQDCYWLQDVQRYQTVYNFSYTSKSR